MRSFLVVGCAAILVAAAAPAQSDPLGSCPSETEIRQSVIKFQNDYTMSASYRDLWKIKSIGDFDFGPIQTGRITQKQVEYGRSAQDVCPVRVAYTFVTETMNGERKPTRHGEQQILYFYKNAFGEWIWKSERG